MSRLRIAIALIFALSSVFAFASGCSSEPPRQQVETKTIVDTAGRSVEIPADPQRVACLYASTAHMLAMVGVEDRIVGAPGGVKRDVLMVTKHAGIADIAVPFQEGIINIEELVEIDADLALVRESTAQSPSEVEKLDKLGIPYIVVDYSSIEELRTAISVVGEAFGRQERADAFLAFYDETIAMVEQRLADVPRERWPRVYHAVNEASRTDRPGDICDEITRIARLDNVSVNTASNLISDAEKSYTTLEQIYQWDPDYIIANDINSVSYMLSDSKWQGLKSVTQGKVYPLPVGVTRWAHPGSMEPHMAILFLARQFYPDRFTDIDIASYTRDYYRVHFDLELTDRQVEDILLGQGMRIAKDGGSQ